MRITISTSDRTVHLVTSKGERVNLRAAEKAALRLFHSLPGPAEEPKPQPIGFALSTDIERADPAPEPYDEDEDTQ